MQALLLIGELITLYAVSGRLTQALYDLVVRLTRSRTIGVTALTLLMFPGTVIHELAHLFTAEILGVRTGKLTLVPEAIAQDPSTMLGTEIRTGSVMIGHSDPFRRYLIGLAPMLVGLIALTALAYFIDWSQWFSWLNLLLVYLLFAVSNAMFSSSEDLKGFVPFALTLIIMVSAAYFAGLRIGLTGTALDLVTRILEGLTKSLGVVLGINVGSLLLIRLFELPFTAHHS
ncbi:hypothetical protein A2363_04220 [Candidatus Gottesmanbacteria bacterium RIFOXYB1_FULL_47_11]|uniref:Uncharacterized protein n=1 Tax=Candidatus Gottesmanbacteria bacterium RIFOXYB1_FULL_47_11 TaxID=1798401 RepID=A0A1F6BFI0_9BACT|nr:MAG: hypothetical protein A2363_04220 [Candidatus Gottesmanbacteria bacterium RIFOXYB1_FULL_47_11]